MKRPEIFLFLCPFFSSLFPDTLHDAVHVVMISEVPVFLARAYGHRS